jgi:hypothetical protein
MNWIHLVMQPDRRHWLVIFIHLNGVVHTVMDSNDFTDFVANEANTDD